MIDDVIQETLKIKQMELVDQLGKVKSINIEIILGNTLPTFIPPIYDLRAKISNPPVYRCKISKCDIPIIINEKNNVEIELKKIFEKIKITLEIKEELNKSFYHITSKRKGEISYFITETMHSIDRTRKFFASFGSGNTIQSVYKPILKYLDEIIIHLKPEYNRILDEWELLFHKVEYFRLTENSPDF
jgi:hypothetical protein